VSAVCKLLSPWFDFLICRASFSFSRAFSSSWDLNSITPYWWSVDATRMLSVPSDCFLSRIDSSKHSVAALTSNFFPSTRPKAWRVEAVSTSLCLSLNIRRASVKHSDAKSRHCFFSCTMATVKRHFATASCLLPYIFRRISRAFSYFSIDALCSFLFDKILPMEKKEFASCSWSSGTKSMCSL